MEQGGLPTEVRKLVLLEGGAVRLDPGCRDTQAYMTPNRKTHEAYFKILLGRTIEVLLVGVQKPLCFWLLSCGQQLNCGYDDILVVEDKYN